MFFFVVVLCFFKNFMVVWSVGRIAEKVIEEFTCIALLLLLLLLINLF